MRVLIAEDDRISRRMLQRQLEQWGHEVAAAEDGVQAWEQFKDGEFSVIITDWMMPEMDGLDLVRRIRDTPGRSYVYIILLTAKTEKEDIVLGMEAGADDFLSKPFDRNELRVRVRAGERIIELERSLALRNEQLGSVNKRMLRDLEAAARVQQSLLPTSIPQSPGVELAWSFRPCDELAGDFLNVLALDDEHLAVYVADVSGHGVVAALLAVTISRVLNAQATSSSVLRRPNAAGPPTIVPPAEVIRELNQRFPMDDSGIYFTIVYGILRLTDLQFRYASAGHNPILHLPATGSPRFLDGEGFPIGWDADAEANEHAITLAPGDRLVLYSDGVTEAVNDQLEEYGEKGLIDACLAVRSENLQEEVESLMATVEQWCGATGPR